MSQAETESPSTESPTIESLTAELFDSLGEECGEGESEERVTERLISRAQEIRRIAEMARSTGLFRDAQARYLELKGAIETGHDGNKRLLVAWTHLLERVSSAPTRIHLRAVVRLCFPLVADFLPAH